MNKSVCFTGHRTIAEDKETLSARLYALLERFVTEQKVTDFYTGGAVGWDALAALTVLKLRENYTEVKLHLVLPCPFEEQSTKWNEAQKTEYLHIFLPMYRSTYQMVLQFPKSHLQTHFHLLYLTDK